MQIIIKGTFVKIPCTKNLGCQDLAESIPSLVDEKSIAGQTGGMQNTIHRTEFGPDPGQGLL